MSNYDIEIKLDETLELDTIIQKSSSAKDPINNITYDGESNYTKNILDGFETKTALFSPPEPGVYNMDINGQKISINVTDTSTIPDSSISQEEDGNLSEYSGTTNLFSINSSDTISGSDHSIELSSNSNPNAIEAEFNSKQYENYSFYIKAPSSTVKNNEITFVDSNTGNAVFCVWFGDPSVSQEAYYSAPAVTSGSIQNTGSINSYNNGVYLTGGLSSYRHIQFTNIDWENETIDIAVDGSIVVNNQDFQLSGTPDIINISTNDNTSSSSGSLIDKVDTEPF